MDIGEFNGCSLYTGLRLDYRLRLWAPTSALHAVSAVVELLVILPAKQVDRMTGALRWSSDWLGRLSPI